MPCAVLGSILGSGNTVFELIAAFAVAFELALLLLVTKTKKFPEPAGK
jgi:hypothetical protein